MEKSLSNNQIQVILQGLERQIAEHQRKIMDLQDAKKAFMVQYGLEQGGPTRSATGNGSGRGRLATGVPRKYVHEALEAMPGPVTIGALNAYIEEIHGKSLADGTIRRVIGAMKNEMKVFQNEDGTWELVREPDGDENYPL